LSVNRYRLSILRIRTPTLLYKMKKRIASTFYFLLFVCSLNAQLIPSYLPAENEQEKTILNITESLTNHPTLLAAIRAAELEEVLDNSGPFTVFAPSDKAFENFTEKDIEVLLKPENKKRLKSLMTYHMIAGDFSASKILSAMCQGKGKATFTTVQGGEITATMNGLDIILTDDLGNTAKIIIADSTQCYGVIHEIDAVIQPIKL